MLYLASHHSIVEMPCLLQITRIVVCESQLITCLKLIFLFTLLPGQFQLFMKVFHRRGMIICEAVNVGDLSIADYFLSVSLSVIAIVFKSLVRRDGIFEIFKFEVDVSFNFLGVVSQHEIFISSKILACCNFSALSPRLQCH